jgi:hypothetical protein
VCDRRNLRKTEDLRGVPLLAEVFGNDFLDVRGS